MLDNYDNPEDEAPQPAPDVQDFYGARIKINEAKELLANDKPLTIIESMLKEMMKQNIEQSLGNMDPHLRSENLHVHRGQHIFGNTLLTLRPVLQEWVDAYNAQHPQA